MNTIIKYSLSRKYAVAFMRVFEQKVDEHLNRIQDAVFLLKPKKQFFSDFSISIIPKKSIGQFIKQFLHYLQLPDCFLLVAMLLIAHNRFHLFFDVLECIKNLALDKKNQQEIFIYTANSLSENDILKIEELMSVMKKKSVSKMTCIISSDLIAGIRVLSNDFVLDCSVRGQLVKLHTILKQEGIIYE